MKLSHGLAAMLQPLLKLAQETSDSLTHSTMRQLGDAVKRNGKRGFGPYYPTDIKKVNVVLETLHDATGKVLSVPVIDCNFANAIEHLKAWLEFEDYLCDLRGIETLHN